MLTIAGEKVTAHANVESLIPATVNPTVGIKMPMRNPRTLRRLNTPSLLFSYSSIPIPEPIDLILFKKNIGFLIRACIPKSIN
jgi:hypothetical protein